MHNSSLNSTVRRIKWQAQSESNFRIAAVKFYFIPNDLCVE